MPFYEYRCDECSAVREAFQKMSEPPLEKCESCGGRLRKVMHPVAVHFKGSGFYTTDYGRGGKKQDDGYAVLEREKLRRAEQGDPICARAVEAETSSSSSDSSSGKDGKPKEKQKAT